MIIWRSLSPSVLARVLELALPRPSASPRPADGPKTAPQIPDEQKTSRPT